MSEAQETSDYPGSLDSWVTLTDKEDLAEASDLNKIKAAILATQTEIGTDPAGSVADLKTRLAVIIANSGAIRQGTSFPGTTETGMIFYKTDEDVLYIRNAADDTWLSLGQSLSNMIFCWSGSTDSGNLLLKNGVSTLTDTGGSAGYVYYATDSTAYVNVFFFRWTKIAGVSTVTVIAEIWQDSGSAVNNEQAALKVDIGGQNNEVTGTARQTTPELVTFTIDVSSLSNGTTYNVSIQLKRLTVNTFAYLGYVALLGS